ncbi:hypothetical protein, partial [Streptomyces bambusae]
AGQTARRGQTGLDQGTRDPCGGDRHRLLRWSSSRTRWSRTARPSQAWPPTKRRAAQPGGELFCYIPLARALRGGIGVTGFAA